MARPLLTMDTRGQIYDANMKLQWLLSYMLTTEASQSNLFMYRILSIPDINRRYNNDIAQFKRTLEEGYKRLLEVYFDECEVFVDDKPMEDPSKVKIILKANALQDGVWYGLSEALLVTNDKVTRVAEFHNV